MGTPGIITGGDGDPGVADIFRRTATDSSALSRQGVFGRNPGSTAKYAQNANTAGRGRDAEYRESMARLFVEVPANAMERFLATVGARARPLARVLAVATDGSNTGGTGFFDFLMTRAQEDFAEKAQIVDTLTDNYVAFYSGQVPPVFRYGGTLLNTYQDDQRVWMLQLYREILRGTRLANRGLIARLRYDSFIVSGYLESLSLSLQGATEHTASNFTFSLRVKRLNIFTEALGAPTVAQTAATTNSILSGSSELSEATARRGAITAETVTDASSRPGASPAQPTEMSLVSSRERLRAAGISDEDVTGIMSAAAEEAGGTDVDPREAEVDATQEGTQRMEAATSNGAEPNSSNVSEDGQGGLSNVRGTLGPASSASQGTSEGDGSVVTTSLSTLTSLRRRGGLSQ